MNEEKLSVYIAHLREHPEEFIEFYGIKLTKFQKWYIRTIFNAKDKLKMPIDWRF